MSQQSGDPANLQPSCPVRAAADADAEAGLSLALPERDSPPARPLAVEVARLTACLQAEREEHRRIERELRTSQETLQAFMDAITESALLMDAQGGLLAANRTMIGRLGLDPRAAIGNSVYALVPPDVAARRRAYVEQVIQTGQPLCFEDERLGRCIENTLYPVFDDQGLVSCLAVLGLDITERRETQAALDENRRRLQTLISNLPGIAYRCRNDPDWSMEFLSEGCQGLTGYTAAELIGNSTCSYADLIHPADRRLVWEGVQTGVCHQGPFQLTYRIRTADGGEKWVWEKGQGIFDAAGQLEALEGFITDITERRLAEMRLNQTLAELEQANRALAQANGALEEAKRALEQSLARQAELAVRDPLTGLYNRRDMDRALREELARCARYGQPVGFLILDLDHFKAINDTWGHPAGDQVLIALARLLEKEVRPNDRLIRYGGEEFALIAPFLTPTAGVMLAERIRERVAATPFAFIGPDGQARAVRLTVSLGLACAPMDATTAEGLLAQADAGLYRAKRRGRNRVEGPVASAGEHEES